MIAVADRALPYPFDLGFMQRALAACLAVGVFAPMIGVFLVQKRMSLIGDGIGHLAFAGVGAGVLAGFAPLWAALAVRRWWGRSRSSGSAAGGGPPATPRSRSFFYSGSRWAWSS